MYAAPRRFSLYIRNRIRQERRQEKSRTALGRGISEGVRLNDNQIVVSRGAQRIPQMGYFYPTSETIRTLRSHGTKTAARVIQEGSARGFISPSNASGRPLGQAS